MSYLTCRLVVAAERKVSAVACEGGFLRKMIEISMSQKLDVTAVNYPLGRRLYDDLDMRGQLPEMVFYPKRQAAAMTISMLQI